MLWKRTIGMLVAFGVLTVIAAAVAAIPERGKGPTVQLPPFDQAAVVKVEVTGAAGNYALVKKGEQWRIEPGDYLADGASIDRTLETLANLRLGALVSSRSVNHEKYEVTDDGLTITPQTAESRVWTLVVGKESADKRGNYVRQKGDDRVFVALTRLRDSFGKGANRWRERSITKFDKDQANKLALTRDGKTLSFAKGEDGAWAFDPIPAELPPAFRLDQEKVGRIVRTMSSLTAADFESAPAESVDRGLDPARLVVRVGLADGTNVALALGAEKDKNIYAQKEGDAQVYLVASYNANNLQKGLEDLRDLHVVSFTPDQAVKLAIQEGARHLVLEKGEGDKWRVADSSDPVPEGFVFDPAKAQTLARSASTLQGASLVGTSAPPAAKLGNPAGTVSVTLDDGTVKRIAVGAETGDDQRYVAGDGYVYLVRKAVTNNLLKKLSDFQVTAQRQQQPTFSPEMLDKLPPQLRDQFLQQQRQKILQNQIMQQMMKKADKEKGKGTPPPP